METSPVRLQALVGAAERLQERGGKPVDWMGCVEQALDRLRQRPFRAHPVRLHTIHQEGKARDIADPDAVDRLIEEALLTRVAEAVETRLCDAVHGYRRGRSTYTAAIRAGRMLAEGRHQILMLDIASFFPSIHREPLRGPLEELLGNHVAEIVMGLAEAPSFVGNEVLARPKGLLLGRALSPLLANLALTALDDAVAESGCGYVRYGDDMFLAARSDDERSSAEGLAAHALAELGLSVAMEKTRRLTYSGSPVLYLGHAIDDRGLFERLNENRLKRVAGRAAVFDEGAGDAPTDRVLQPNVRTRTLYLTEPGVYVRVEQARLVIQRGKDVLREVPLHRIDRILVLAGIALSSSVLSSCISEGIPVLFFVGRGRTYGSLVSGGMPSPLRLRAQYDLSSRAEARLALGREVIDAKLRAMLRRLDREPRAATQRSQIEALARRIPEAMDGADLRGIEGAATRFWYEVLALRISHADFRFEETFKATAPRSDQQSPLVRVFPALRRNANGPSGTRPRSASRDRA